jgi:hypothetical protein
LISRLVNLLSAAAMAGGAVVPRPFEEVLTMTKKEQRLVKRAAAALLALAQFREKHGLTGAVADIVVTARINGWPEEEAREIARHMLAAGVTAAQARQLFAEADARRQ